MNWNLWFACLNACNARIPAATCGCVAPPLCGRLARARCSNLSSGKKFHSTMRKWFHQRFSVLARLAVLFQVLTVVFLAAPFVPLASATGTEGPGAIEPSQPADPGSPHVSAVRSGMLETRDGLTLRL